MRRVHTFHFSHPAVKSVRFALAAGAVAGLVVIAACTDSGGKTITAPTGPRTASTSSGGFGNAKHIDLCVSASSPAGNYTFVNDRINRSVAQDGFGIALTGNGFFSAGQWFDSGDGGTGTTSANALAGVNYLVTAGGSCVRVIDRTSGDIPFMAIPRTQENDSWAAATIRYTGTNTSTGAVYDHTDCVNDLGVLIEQKTPPPAVWPVPGYPCDTGNNPTRAFANFEHGSVVTFVFVTPPVQQVIPLFVIGDIEPHGIGDVVNFWGPQWWKNNPMTLLSTKGWESFKGFAANVDLTPGPNAPCGTWTSRVGNSPPPPQTIPEFVGIIVANNVVKIGPGEGGNIQQIVIVQSDGGYSPAPGHRGNGPVTEIVCPI